MGVMARTPLLAEAELAPLLAAIPDWTRTGDEIERTFELASFPDAIAFVVRVALTTHDSGGLTALDLDLAQKIEAVA